MGRPGAELAVVQYRLLRHRADKHPGPRVTGPVPQTMRLPDGRRLAWYEFGDPAGVPCLYLPGTPESGLAGGCYHSAARKAGVRWISVDKPGYGRSDPCPRRSLAQWAADAGQLVARLRLESFAVAGESGGGPHALAVSHALADTVTMTVLLAAMGPGHEPWVRKGMRPTNVMFFYLTLYCPAALRVPLAVMRQALRVPPVAAWMERRAPAADRAAVADPDYQIRHLAVPDAFRGGTRAAAEELQLFARPWGFDLSEITGPVHVWHGGEDVNVPIAVARGMAAALPDAVTHFFPAAAHAVGFEQRDAVMEIIAGATRPGSGKETT
jgi:pimeloyl-ACP methyl ester carboxylesterase